MNVCIVAFKLAQCSPRIKENCNHFGNLVPWIHPLKFSQILEEPFKPIMLFDCINIDCSCKLTSTYASKTRFFSHLTPPFTEGSGRQCLHHVWCVVLWPCAKWHWDSNFPGQTVIEFHLRTSTPFLICGANKMSSSTIKRTCVRTVWQAFFLNLWQSFGAPPNKKISEGVSALSIYQIEHLTEC